MNQNFSYIPDTFDVIVIGAGSMGASACYFLAKRGLKVLGLEQFDIPHEQGAHAGQSRIIRKAYFEHPAYVPLLMRAYENWRMLEKETGAQVFYRAGLLYAGNPEHPVMKGIKQSADSYHIPMEKINAGQLSQRFFQFNIPAHYETLFEPDAGFVTPEKAILLFIEEAIKKGATIRTKEKVLEWKKDGNHIVVITDKKTYRAGRLIITAGAWAGKMIPGLEGKIKITRQYIAWIKPKKWADYSLREFPCWLIADDGKPGVYYGFPVLPVATFGGPVGLKLAHHTPGISTDPDNVNRQSLEEDEKNLKYALNKYLPGAFESLLSFKICLYANTPDENFIIDKLPGYGDHVIIACGFSGHGFKFASAIGEILADLAIEGKAKLNIDFLSAKRFA